MQQRLGRSLRSPGWNLAKLLILIWILARGAIRNNHAQAPHDIQDKKGGAA
jgi:hypothetical protein